MIDVPDCMGHTEGSIMNSSIIYCPQCSNVRKNEFQIHCNHRDKRLRAIFHKGDEPRNIPETSKEYLKSIKQLTW